MLKTYQFKTHCKVNSHSSKNCKYHFATAHDKKKVFHVSTNKMQLNLNTMSLAHVRAFTFVLS